jgi:hypothetical protein
MKVHWKAGGGRLMFEVEAETAKDLFRSLARLQEIFEADTACGCCGKTELRFTVRTVQDNEFFELTCLQCGAELSFGQRKKGGELFPRRNNDTGNALPNRGWKKYQGRL